MTIVTLLFALAALSVGHADGMVPLNVGVVLAATNYSCAQAVLYANAMYVARDAVLASSWWTLATNKDLQLSIRRVDMATKAWQAALELTHADGTPVVGLIGHDGDAVAVMQLVAEAYRTPLVAFDAPALTLSDSDYTACVSPDAEEFAGAVAGVFTLFQWQYVIIVAEPTPDYLSMAKLVTAQLGSGVTIEAQILVDDQTAATVAVQALEAQPARVVLLIASTDIAVAVMAAAHQQGVYGKGWAWIGTEWLASMFAPGSVQTAAADADLAAARQAAQGAIGIVASMNLAARYDGGKLLRAPPGLFAQLNCSNRGDPTEPTTFAAGDSELAGYAFDSVWLLAGAIAATPHCTTSSGSACTGELVYQSLLSGSELPVSPVSGAHSFSKVGYVIGQHTDFQLINALEDNTVQVVGQLSGQGKWMLSASITWPGSDMFVPVDRAFSGSETQAWLTALVITGLLLSHLVVQSLPKRVRPLVPESGITVALGAALGLLLRFGLGSQAIAAAAKFDQTVFTLILLPIIVFQSAYEVRKYHLFSQAASIITFAVVGTLITAMIIGGIMFAGGQWGWMPALDLEECLAFGSILAATDPVATLATLGALHVNAGLNAIVYGEALLNDAVSIVLVRTFQAFFVERVTGHDAGVAIGMFIATAVGSVRTVLTARCITCWSQTAIGMGVGLICPVVLARVPTTSGHIDVAVLESALVLMFAYLSFAVSEGLRLSGIVSSLVTGLVLNHYIRGKLLSDAGKACCSWCFGTLANIAESLVFVLVGMNVVIFSGAWNTGFCLLTMFACLLSRALTVWPLSWLLNRFRRRPIPKQDQVLLFVAGLRGAVAYAQSVSFPSQHNNMVVSATSFVVIVTMFILGPVAKPTVIQLGIELDNCAEDGAASDTDASLASEPSRAERLLAQFDRAFLGKVLGLHEQADGRHAMRRSPSSSFSGVQTEMATLAS